MNDVNSAGAATPAVATLTTGYAIAETPTSPGFRYRGPSVVGGGESFNLFNPPEPGFARAALIWGTAHLKSRHEIVVISPVGSREDSVLFWRTGGRVATGWAGSHACFEGSLDEFEAKIDSDYGGRIRRWHEANDGTDPAFLDRSELELTTQHLNDYRAVVAFLRSL